MFDQLDNALKKLLDQPALHLALPELLAAETSFATPERGYLPSKDAVNLFLFETKENRELRSALPNTQSDGSMELRRRAPLRVDCTYLVTAWSIKKGIDKVAAEHRLLSQAFNWLSRFPRVPLRCFDAVAQPSQLFDPPTMVAQMDGAKSAGEFWTALGIPPRPYFNLMITLTMDLNQTFEDSIVSSVSAAVFNLDRPVEKDEYMVVAGTVRGREDGNPVPGAWVRIEPQGETAITDANGRFILEHVVRGSGMILRARAPGFKEAERLGLDIPSLTGEYDLTFPP